MRETLVRIDLAVVIEKSDIRDGFTARTKCNSYSGWGWTEEAAIDALKKEINRYA